jgi:capsular polysaccharide biosynthesis protein
LKVSSSAQFVNGEYAASIIQRTKKSVYILNTFVKIISSKNVINKTSSQCSDRKVDTVVLLPTKTACDAKLLMCLMEG